MANPPLLDATRESARREFDKWALSYDRSLLREIVFLPGVRACQEEILRWKALRASPHAPYRLLDVGCGTGNLVGVMGRDTDVGMAVGLDYSPVMVEKAAGKIREHGAAGRNVFAVHADSERLPFADESFDVLTCANSFHHYPNQAEVVREFRRVLRPGGVAILVDGFRDNVIGWLVFDVGVATAEKNVHHASWTEVRGHFSAAGFQKLAQRKLNVLAPLLVTTAIA